MEIKSELIDRTFGFPIRLVNVSYREVFGEQVFDIEYGTLADTVLRKVIEQRSRLTGAQIRFIRNHLRMTMERFAERFGVTHPAVKKWEDSGDTCTVMAVSTERDIRLCAFQNLRFNCSNFEEFYRNISKPFLEASEIIEIDISFDSQFAEILEQLAPSFSNSVNMFVEPVYSVVVGAATPVAYKLCNAPQVPAKYFTELKASSRDVLPLKVLTQSEEPSDLTDPSTVH